MPGLKQGGVGNGN